MSEVLPKPVEPIKVGDHWEINGLRYPREAALEAHRGAISAYEHSLITMLYKAMEGAYDAVCHNDADGAELIMRVALERIEASGWQS